MSRPGEVDRSRVTSIEPGPLRRDRALLQLWGDSDAGWVNDWVYVSSECLYQIVLSLPPGSGFRHSERNRTVYGADELYYVLEGRLLLCNPETGEVVSLDEGDAAWFGPDTWHHGFAGGEGDVRVLEFFAPPPAAGMSQAYARTRPYLSEPTYLRNEWLGRWTPGTAGPAERTIHAVDPATTLWRLEGEERVLLVGILLSTERLTVATAELLPDRLDGVRVHEGDLGLYVLQGRLDVLLPHDASQDVFHLAAGDGFFVPAGTRYRFGNSSETSASFLFAVAPTYRPAA